MGQWYQRREHGDIDCDHRLRIIMSAFWRTAGLNYVQFSAIAGRVTRSALKPAAQESAAKRAIQSVKFQVGEWKASGCQGLDLKLKTEVDIFHRQRRQCNVVTK